MGNNNRQEIADEAMKEKKKIELYQKTHNGLTQQRSKLENDLLETKVKVDQEYVLKSKLIEAKSSVLEELILEINDIERQHEEYVIKLKQDLIYDDPKYKELCKKIDSLAKKIPGMTFGSLSIQDYSNSGITSINNEGSLWYNSQGNLST
jgi:hypothetical protein